MGRADAALAIVHARNVGDRCKALLAFYRHARAEIVATPHAWGIDPYEVRWNEVFTPIEAAMWHELRRLDLVFYPQLPVGKAFVDFGNAFHKVAIECDGREWHLDWLKDQARDIALAERGWRVYRISGSDCLAEQDETDFENTEPTPVRRFALDIAALFARRLAQQVAA